MNKLRHVGIVVGDLIPAVKWYEQFNFFPFSFETVEIAGKAVQLCKMYHKDGSCLELLDGVSAVPHISLSVNYLEFKNMKFSDAGIFEKENSLYIKDPWNNIIEIVEVE